MPFGAVLGVCLCQHGLYCSRAPAVIDTTSHNKATKYAPGHGYEARGGTPSAILIHSTNNKRPTQFIDECDFLFTSPAVSAHFLISKAGAVVQLAAAPLGGLARRARACAVSQQIQHWDGAHVSVGERPTISKLAALSALCRALMTNYGIDLGRIDNRAVACPKAARPTPRAGTTWPSTPGARPPAAPLPLPRGPGCAVVERLRAARLAPIPSRRISGRRTT